MDLWFLMDAEKGLWVERYSIRIERAYAYFWPLVVLDDGRIVVVIHGRRGLQTLEIHDPTNTVSVVADTSRCCAIGVYTGNLLSLERCQPENNDGAESAQKVSKDALGLKPRWVTGFCQIKSLCSGLADALLSAIFGKFRV